MKAYGDSTGSPKSSACSPSLGSSSDIFSSSSLCTALLLPLCLRFNCFRKSSFSSCSIAERSGSCSGFVLDGSCCPLDYLNTLKFSCNIATTCLILKIAPSVLFLRMKQSRTKPSHSVKLIGGGGNLGSILTTLDSTFGGGLKLLRETLIK